ncbi:hypothetical protein EVA_20074 [gut metagenome]|uniref:Uncharacterized protein n=1 Tax=gut metagenome TaxID=749906 RepID=J9BW70_9ZZZZ
MKLNRKQDTCRKKSVPDQSINSVWSVCSTNFQAGPAPSANTCNSITGTQMRPFR